MNSGRLDELKVGRSSSRSLASHIWGRQTIGSREVLQRFAGGEMQSELRVSQPRSSAVTAHIPDRSRVLARSSSALVGNGIRNGYSNNE